MKIQREFKFTRSDFDTIRSRIYQHAGIAIAPTKEELVYTRIRKRVREHGLVSFAAYLDYLDANPGELQAFINSLTTNFTSFFRESEHFGVLRTFFEERKTRGVRVWCAASSSGEEAYSIAITLAETFGTSTSKVTMLASDIDTDVLAKAERGVYPDKALESVEDAFKKRYFLRGTGGNAGYVRVVQQLRDLIVFRPLNLLDDNWDVDRQYDVIFCRNVLFYFDKPTQRTILARMRERLGPDGLLFTGHSENFFNEHALFKPVSHSVYRPAGKGVGAA